MLVSNRGFYLVGVLGDQDNQDIACIDDSDCVHLGNKAVDKNKLMEV